MDTYTEVVIILDCSGSMASLWGETVQGFQTFLSQQQELPGRANLTLVQFNAEHQVLLDAVDIQAIHPEVLSETLPYGVTALMDAVGWTLERLNERISALEEKPTNVIVAIITDGFENASRHFSRQQIAALIKDYTNEKQWNFVFLGANQDATLEGGSVSVQAGNTQTFSYDTVGISTAWNTVYGATCSVRGLKTTAALNNLCPDENEKKGS